MRSRGFYLIRSFLKLCIICSTLGKILNKSDVTCNNEEEGPPCGSYETCNESDFFNNLQITRIPSEDNNIDLYGIVEVNFTMPYLHCIHNFQLLVNESVTEDACKNYKFPIASGYNSQLLHSYYSLDPSPTSHEVVNNTHSCQIPKSINFQHVFTGCYMLKYEFNTMTAIMNEKSQYIKTNYIKSDLTVENCKCVYNIYKNCSKECDEYTEIKFDGAIPADVRHWRFEVYLSENWGPVTCSIKYDIFMDNASSYTDYCDIHRGIVDGNLKIVNCMFPICAPENTDYSAKMSYQDNRIIENGIWHPKHIGIFCEDCQTSVNKVDCPQSIPTSEASDYTYKWVQYLCIGMLITVVIIGLIIFLYVFYLRRKNVTESDEIRTDERRSTSGSKDSNVDDTNNLIPLDDKSNGILLLYVKSSPSFLAFMTSFRTILKRCCHCDVYDWYAPDEWSNVATLGPLDWVIERRNMGCRIVWVDTIASRSLVLSNGENHEDLSMVSDFREDAFPLILDIVKHSIKDPASQYQNHFIIRFDSLPDHDSAKDPFADISPHVRYLMPRHFNQLCFDLSKQSSMADCSTSIDMSTNSEVQQELQRLMNTLQSD